MVKHAELPGTVTAYEVSGDGPPVLLMHGAEGSRHSFTAFAAALSRHATVINYDQRDCGETAKKHDGISTLIDVARDAAELIDHLGFKSVSVLGVSLGGRVAQTFAIRYPERLDDLMLCNTWPVNALIADLNPDIRKMLELTNGLPTTARELAAMYYPEAFVDANPWIVERASARSNFPGRAARRALGTEISNTPLSMIKARTLLISGEEDRIVPTRVMRDMTTRIPDCRLVTMPGMGHSPADQAPAELSSIVAAQLGHALR